MHIRSFFLTISQTTQRRILHGKESKIYDVNRQALFEGVEWLDGFLEGERYVAGGDSPSIADFFVMASIGQLIVRDCAFFLLTNFGDVFFFNCSALEPISVASRMLLVGLRPTKSYPATLRI